MKSGCQAQLDLVNHALLFQWGLQKKDCSYVLIGMRYHIYRQI